MEFQKWEKIAHIATTIGVIVALIGLGFSIREQISASTRADQSSQILEGLVAQIDALSKNDEVLTLIIEHLNATDVSLKTEDLFKSFHAAHPDISNFEYQSAILLGIQKHYLLSVPLGEPLNPPNIGLDPMIRLPRTP